MSYLPPHIALLVTGQEALADFHIFVKTLETWHPDANLYVFTDSITDFSSIRFKGTLHIQIALDKYKGLNRKAMESLPSAVYDSLFKEYTYEKANVLDWVWSIVPTASQTGVWFMDSDITHLAPLPHIPADSSIALSPHYIRESDCLRFGKYNAGYFWIRDKSLIDVWRSAGVTSRFFEQAALEDVATSASSSLYEFPIQVNFGWWRMFQGPLSPQEVQSKISLNRSDRSIGLRYDGAPLQSIHTHWCDTTNSVAIAFNTWINDYTRRFNSHKPIATFRRSVNFT